MYIVSFLFFAKSYAPVLTEQCSIHYRAMLHTLQSYVPYSTELCSTNIKVILGSSYPRLPNLRCDLMGDPLRVDFVLHLFSEGARVARSLGLQWLSNIAPDGVAYWLGHSVRVHISTPIYP